MEYIFKCKQCDKIITDTIKERFDYNKKQHEEKHRREKEKRD